MDSNATNYNADATMQEYNEFGTSTCTYESCSSRYDPTGAKVVYMMMAHQLNGGKVGGIV